MKKTLALVLALLLVVVAIVGCSGAPAENSASAPASTPPEKTEDNQGGSKADLPLDIVVQVKATESDFWQYMIVGAEQYAKDFPDRVKVTIQGPTKEMDYDKAVSLLEQVVANKPDAIVLASTSSDATVPAVEDAMDQGIPVILADNMLNTEKYTAFLATDNIAGGALAADALVEGMEAKGKTSGKVLVVSSSGGNLVMDARIKGFTEQMKNKYTQYELYPQVLYCENDVAKALDVCAQTFSANKDIVGVFGGNNMSGNGVSRYIAQEKLSETVTCVCYDSDPEEIKNLRNGDLYAMIIQDPSGFGYKGVDMAYKVVAEGYDVEANFPDRYIDTGCTKITAENIDDPELQALIDPTLLKDGKATREWPTYF